MNANRGFSLIETLVAIMIASLTVMALLQAMSATSRHAAGIIGTYERTLVVGTLVGAIDESMYGRTLDAAEILKKSYPIDDSELLERLEGYEISISKERDEMIDPLSQYSNLSGGSAPLRLEEVRVEADGKTKHFVSLTPWGGR